MRLARLLLAAPLFLAACGDDEIVTMTEPAGRPSAAISDAAHNDGTRGFFFLAPIVDQPRSAAFGTFDASRVVTVSVCQLADATTADARCVDDPEVLQAVAVGVDVHGKHYHTNWRTESFAAGRYYRVIVQEGVPGAITGQWGYADVFLGATGRDFRGIDRNEFAPLLDGRTLPIKFRIEQGAQPTTGSGDSGIDCVKTPALCEAT